MSAILIMNHKESIRLCNYLLIQDESTSFHDRSVYYLIFQVVLGESTGEPKRLWILAPISPNWAALQLP